jgi:transposase
MLAEELDYVIGVDTHKDVHALAVICAGTGGVVFELAVPARTEGYAEALRLATEIAPGRRAFAIEGTGSYGSGLARFLEQAGERVLEVGRLPRQGRRSQAKSDALDAIRAARGVLGADKLALPRAGGKRQELRSLVVCREGAVRAKQAGLCQLRDLLLTCPEPLRSELGSLSRARLLRRCVGLRPDQRRDGEGRGSLLALRLLARRLQALALEERELAKEIRTLVSNAAPELLAEPGIGPISAAQILLSFSHPGRLRSEAAFARLAGSAPIPASSGKLIRHRLDPGGDRQLNRALHTIIVSRRKHHPETIAYIERRQHQGKSVREAIRCLKRYLARHLFRLLERATVTT